MVKLFDNVKNKAILNLLIYVHISISKWSFFNFKQVTTQR